LDESKSVNTIAITLILGVFTLYALQHISRIMAPAEVEYPEPYGVLWLYPAGHIMNVSYNAVGEPEYFGEAMPGTASNEAAWRIYRYEYGIIAGEPEVIGVRFANGDTNFDKVWENREDYDYA